MSEWSVVYSPLAKRDLDEIYDYISSEIKNPSAASGTVDAILNAADSLEDFPYVGSLVEGLPPIYGEYRFITVRNYIVFYRLSEGQVFIDRILYGRRDYLRLLGLQ